MKVLVCAARKYGATSEIAQAVADVLAERGCEVTVLPPEEVGAVEEFDAVILGSAVYMGQWMNRRAGWQNARRPRWPPGRCGCFPAARSANRPSPPTTRGRPEDPGGQQGPRPPDVHRQAGQEAPELPDRAMASAIRAAEGRLPQLGRDQGMGNQHRRHPAFLTSAPEELIRISWLLPGTQVPPATSRTPISAPHDTIYSARPQTIAARIRQLQNRPNGNSVRLAAAISPS